MRCPRSWAIAAALAFLSFPGCGGAPGGVKPPDAAEARRVLESALDAWKVAGPRGRSPSRPGPPPAVRLVDDDHAAGRGLEDYRVTGEPEAAGHTLNFPVEITLRDRRGARRNVATIYQVVFAPSVAVLRNDP